MSQSLGQVCQVCATGQYQRYRHDWLERCPHCRVLRSDFEADIPALRSEGAIEEGEREQGLAPTRLINNRRILEAVQRAASGQRLLDIGCGPGFFLKDARAAGFAVIGIEPDANTVERARDFATVRHGYFPAASQPSERYDVIVMNDVFEHVPDPSAVLAACAARLDRGGLLVLNCPNRNGLFFRLAALLDRLGVNQPYARLWQRGLPSPHLWYFTPRNLVQISAAAGFQHLVALPLTTVTLKSLWQRIAYVKGQSRLMNVMTVIGVAAALPATWLAPRDSVAVLFRAGASADQNQRASD